jgi:predicted small metal-binding protein
LTIGCDGYIIGVKFKDGRLNMPKFKCKDTGQKCNFEVKDDNQEELLAIMNLHAQKTHNVNEPTRWEKLKQAIKK